MEKRLMDELRSVAGELPEEVLDDIYHKVYRPVMVTAMKALLKVISR
jgi:ATP/maltotriose-dependent transcriptional regulator MalT